MNNRIDDATGRSTNKISQKRCPFSLLQCIRDVNVKRVLNKGIADSKTFDVTLMICLIRNLTCITPPAFGFDLLPSSGETTPGADIARIKYYRNYLAHLDESKMENSYFKTAWNDISDAVRRLGGSSIYHECENLKTKILDQSNHEVLLEMKSCMSELTDLKKEMKELKSNHDQLKTGHEQKAKEIETLKTDNIQTTQEIVELMTGLKQKRKEIEELTAAQDLKAHDIKKLKADQEFKTKEIEKLKDSVPWNIREQIKRKLETWKKEDKMFVDTLAAKHVLQCTKTNSCVTVTASSGVGKTFTVRHVALQMADDGYDILPVTNPEDIIKFNDPNKKTLYIIDDVCGTYTLNQTSMDKWKKTQDDIKELLINENTKIIASCRLQVYQDEQFKLLPLLTACECNILSTDKSLSKTKKESIAKLYLKSSADKISEYIDLFDFFPLLCKLYNENKALNIVDFFKNPFSVYEKEINKLYTEKAYGKHCALVLCVMFNNYLKEEWLTEDVNQNIQQIIENTCEACRLNRSTSRLVLLDELNSLIHTFLKREQGSYRTVHDKLFDFLSFYFGRTPILSCLIKYGDSQLIKERFLFDRKYDSDKFITIVPEKYHQLYIQRMFDDWSKGLVVKVFTNINMKSPRFRETFLMYLKTSDITHQKQLATKYDTEAYTRHGSMEKLYEENYSIEMKTPLLQCCALRDIHMVEWCCSCGADVNYCTYDGKSPLHEACMGGFTDMVTMLVDNNADVNKCTLYTNESPLSIACTKGFTDIVNKLVDNKADVNISRTFFGTLEKSTLYIACEKGFTEIVNKLVENEADLNKGKLSESPLYIACERGFTAIVAKLVDNGADLNKCKDTGESPLYIACKGGYTDIVSKLVDNKANINRCASLEESPLYIACKAGFTEVVTKLVDNKANINNCTIFGESPLYIACEGGFTDIVTKLVDNNADINKCTKRGISPLYKACEGGYIDIVTKMVDNKADINTCTSSERSPMHVACKGGYTDIVTKLVDNKAEINKCTKRSGESPLYIACKGGYIDIVTKLVDNKADIDKCTWRGLTPLYIACEGGFTDIVTKLVDYKADINKCTEWGESPLYIACEGGYTDIVTKLVDNKADINTCTDDGKSALYIACVQGFIEIVKILMNKGADFTKVDNNGKKPRYIVECQGHALSIDCVYKHLSDKNFVDKLTSIYFA